MSIWKDQGPAKKEAVTPPSEPTPAGMREAPAVAEFSPTVTAPPGTRAPERTPQETLKESLIAADLTIEGKIEGSGHVRIAGRFKGDVNVQGNVYKVASGQLDTPALNFGVIQVGQSVSPVNLAFTNSATGQAGFVEDLKVTFGSITGSNAGFVSTNGGQMTGILAGQSSTAENGTMTVSVNTANAGVVNAQVGLSYITQGTVGGVSNGLGEAGVGSGSFGQ